MLSSGPAIQIDTLRITGPAARSMLMKKFEEIVGGKHLTQEVDEFFVDVRDPQGTRQWLKYRQGRAKIFRLADVDAVESLYGSNRTFVCRNPSGVLGKVGLSRISE